MFYGSNFTATAFCASCADILQAGKSRVSQSVSEELVFEPVSQSVRYRAAGVQPL
jgi:hypothetical protein